MATTDKYNLEGLAIDAADIAEIMIDNYFRQGHVIPGLNDCEYANGIRDAATNESFLNAQGYFKNRGWELLSQDNQPANDEEVLWVLFVQDWETPVNPYIGTYEAAKHTCKVEGYKPHTHFLRLPTKQK